jgi:hypothetical protein
MATEQEILQREYENSLATITGTAAGATVSISASVPETVYDKFKNADQIVYQLSATISANNIGLDATIDGSTWYRLATVSGVGVTSGSTSFPYINYRGFVDTYSSGSIRFDIIQRIY